MLGGAWGGVGRAWWVRLGQGDRQAGGLCLQPHPAPSTHAHERRVFYFSASPAERKAGMEYTLLIPPLAGEPAEGQQGRGGAAQNMMEAGTAARRAGSLDVDSQQRCMPAGPFLEASKQASVVPPCSGCSVAFLHLIL